MSRECHCPEWVIRCAHFGNTTLALAGESNEGRIHANCGYLSSTRPFAVAMVTYFDNCPRCGFYRAHADERWLPSQFDSEAEALAAFYKAERELLEKARALA